MEDTRTDLEKLQASIKRCRRNLYNFEKTRMDIITIECENLVPKVRRQLREDESKIFDFKLNRKFAEFCGWVYEKDKQGLLKITNKGTMQYCDDSDETVLINFLEDKKNIKRVIDKLIEKGFVFHAEITTEQQHNIHFLSACVDSLKLREV